MLLFRPFLLAVVPLLVAATSQEPEFGDLVENITVAVSREAVLSCVVDYLGTYKVAWIKVDTQTILTIHTHVITHNSRVGASHNGHRIWNLHIRQIKEEDRGFYMCQINTSPMRSQVGYIEVVVPPDIVYRETSSDLSVAEGSSIGLVCRTTGYPQPKTTWRREDNGAILLRAGVGRDKVKVTVVENESLNITKVTRKHMGAYLCIASNGVPPSVSRRIMLQVNFEPSIRVPNQLVGAPPGKEVVLECLVEASPKGVNFWTRENGDMIISSSKYEVLEVESSYQVHFKLKIRDLEEKDFGAYNCISKNLLGEAEGQIRLHEIDLATVKNRLETKDSSYATDGIEDLVSTNLTLSTQKGLDSYKHSLVNQVDESVNEKSKLSARPAKGDDASDRKYSDVLNNLNDKIPSGSTGERASCCHPLVSMLQLPVLAAILLAHYLLV